MKIDCTTSFEFEPDNPQIDDCASFIRNCLYISGHIRADSVVVLYLYAKPYKDVVITVLGRELKGIGYSQHELIKMIKKCLFSASQIATGHEVHVGKGIYVKRENFKVVLSELISKNRCFVLEKEGNKLKLEQKEDVCFIIGEPKGFDYDFKNTLIDFEKINVGKTVLHASQVPSIIHYNLDSVDSK